MIEFTQSLSAEQQFFVDARIEVGKLTDEEMKGCFKMAIILGSPSVLVKALFQAWLDEVKKNKAFEAEKAQAALTN